MDTLDVLDDQIFRLNRIFLSYNINWIQTDVILNEHIRDNEDINV
jgi:hypothetical protein